MFDLMELTPRLAPAYLLTKVSNNTRLIVLTLDWESLTALPNPYLNLT